MTGIGTGVSCSTCATLPSAVDSRATLSTSAERSGADAVAKAASSQIEVAKYFSPRVSYDQQAGIFVVQFRNNQTGEVELQIPPDRVIREYQRIQQQRSEEAAAQGNVDRNPVDANAQPAQVSTSDNQANSGTSSGSGDGQSRSASTASATAAADSGVTV